ncbi:hypothetical protein V3C99_009241 [Haemonchus contortus]
MTEKLLSLVLHGIKCFLVNASYITSILSSKLLHYREPIGELLHQLKARIIPTHYGTWLRRRISKRLILFSVVTLLCCLHLFRIINNYEFFVLTARRCMQAKADWFRYADDKDFFQGMWKAMPNLVNICSYSKLWNRISVFGKDGEDVLFLEELITDPTHHCDIVFLTEDGLLALPFAMKVTYDKCRVHSSSDTHHTIRTNPTLGIRTYPFRVNPKGRLKTDLFEDIDPKELKNMSFVTFMSFFVRRFRTTSIIIRTKNANEFLPIFFEEGIFPESNMKVCQLNIAYPKPKTAQEIEDFRIAWNAILYEKNYLLTHASRTKDTLNMFLVNLNDLYCWQKYLSHILPHYVNY